MKGKRTNGIAATTGMQGLRQGNACQGMPVVGIGNPGALQKYIADAVGQRGTGCSWHGTFGFLVRVKVGAAGKMSYTFGLFPIHGQLYGLAGVFHYARRKMGFCV